MRLTAFICILLMHAKTGLLAQFPSFGSYTVGSVSTVSFKSFAGNIKTEVPPCVLSGGMNTYFFVDGNGTNIYTTPQTLTQDGGINLDVAYGPIRASESYAGSADYNGAQKVQNWKRNYHAIYSAVYFNHPTEGPISLGFLHGENKNVAVAALSDPFAHLYENTIQQNVLIDPGDPGTWSGGNPYHEGWKAYNGIISASWIPNNSSTNWGQQFFQNDLGPIAWPSTGYVTTAGIKCTSGLRHPSSIIYQDTVYIFYVEEGAFGNNIPDEEGRREGIKVVRAALSDALDPHKYQTYYRDATGKDTWNPSLPGGFTKEQMLDFVSVKGPKATDLMNNDKGLYQEIRFTVASLRNTGYFVGIEEYYDLADQGKVKLALHYSTDLIHWSDRSQVIYTAKNWNESVMNYPIFLSKDGSSNTDLDEDDFYVLGTGSQAGNFVNNIHLSAPSTHFSPVFSQFSTMSAAQLSTAPIYPNPTQGRFRFNYSVNTEEPIQIAVFDINGYKLITIDEGSKTAGLYSLEMDLGAFPAGAYLVVLYQGKKPTVYKIVKS